VVAAREGLQSLWYFRTSPAKDFFNTICHALAHPSLHAATPQKDAIKSCANAGVYAKTAHQARQVPF
jgi:hypothetical protein